MRKPRKVELTLAAENTQPCDRPGEQLRATREKLGWSIEEVSDQLHLRPARIEELEQNQYGNMAGATYVQGYLRNYARLLKLDDAVLLQQYGRIQALSDGSPAQPLIEPLIKGHLPHHHDSAARYLWLLLILVVLMAGGWWWQSQRLARNNVPDSAAIDQPSSAAVIVSSSSDNESTVATPVRTADSANNTTQTAAITGATKSVENKEKSPVISTPISPDLSTSIIATELPNVDSQGSAKRHKKSSPKLVAVVKTTAGSQVATEPAARKQLAVTETAGSENLVGTVVSKPKKTSTQKSTADLSTKPGLAPERAARKKSPSHQQNISTRVITDSTGTRLVAKGKSAAIVKTGKRGNNVTTTSKANNSKIQHPLLPKLQLSDDYRTLMLYFDLGSWVDIRDVTGKRLMNRMVVQGRTLSVQGSPPFRIFLGNRQAVRIMYRGKPVQVKDSGTGMFARFTVGQPLPATAR